MDEAIESVIFKMCVLSSMFVEYHALPARAGKTEIKMLQLAFALRTTVYFEVFKTFVHHIWIEPEKFFVSRAEFVVKMSEYPLSHFLLTSTFRKMIELRKPDSAASIHKSARRVLGEAGEASDNLQMLRTNSRPDLGKVGYQKQIYEKGEQLNNSLAVPAGSLMLASTASQENFCKLTFAILTSLLPPTVPSMQQ